MISFILGFLIGFLVIYWILPEKIENHGPDSSIIREQIHYDDKGNKIKFVPTPIIPPIKII